MLRVFVEKSKKCKINHHKFAYNKMRYKIPDFLIKIKALTGKLLKEVIKQQN